MPRRPKAVSAEVAIRLAKAADEMRDRKDSYRAAVEQRDQLVVEAIDLHGMAHTAVAKAIGVAPGRISAILAGSQPDAGGEE